MKININNNKKIIILNLIAIILLIGTLFDFPYFYYQILRWYIFIAFIFIIYNLYLIDKIKFNILIYIYWFIAIIFNPISPFYFWWDIWFIIDIITVFVIVFNIFYYNYISSKISLNIQ